MDTEAEEQPLILPTPFFMAFTEEEQESGGGVPVSLVRSITFGTSLGGGQRANYPEPKGQWTETDCVYRHGLQRSPAINDNKKKR